MDEYLASAPVVSTGHLDEAREAVSRIYLRHELVGSDRGMAMRLNAVVDRVMTVGYLTYQADTELIMPATEDCYVVNLTLVGGTKAAAATGGGRSLRRTGAAWCCHRSATTGSGGPPTPSSCT